MSTDKADHVSPFELAYSAAFLFGVALAIWETGSTLSHIKGPKPVSLLVTLLLAVTLVFQYFRMYFHLHKFDHVGAHHFIAMLTGKRRIVDRAIRLMLAATLIVVHEEHVGRLFLRSAGRLHGYMDGIVKYFDVKVETLTLDPHAAELLTLHSLALLIAFLLLIMWDINIWCHRDNSPFSVDGTEASFREFYYVGAGGVPCSYFATLKFLERALGWSFALAFVTLVAYPSDLVLFIAIPSLALFALIAFLNSHLTEVLWSPFVPFVKYFSVGIAEVEKTHV